MLQTSRIFLCFHKAHCSFHMGHNRSSDDIICCCADGVTGCPADFFLSNRIPEVAQEILRADSLTYVEMSYGSKVLSGYLEGPRYMLLPVARSHFQLPRHLYCTVVNGPYPMRLHVLANYPPFPSCSPTLKMF